MIIGLNYLNFGGRLLGMLLSYCILLALTHLLTKDEYASYVLVITYSNLLMLLGTLGAHEVLKYERAHVVDDDSVINVIILRYVFKSSIFVGVTLFLLLLLGNILFDLKAIYILISVLIVPNIMIEVFNARKIADRQVLQSIYMYYIFRNGLLLLFLLVSQIFYDLNALLAVLCNIAAIYLVYVFYTSHYYNDIFVRVSGNYWNLNWQHGLRNIVLIGVSTLILSIDVMMLAIFSTPADVADYNFVSRLVQMPVLLLVAMNPGIGSYIINNIKYFRTHEFGSFITKNTTRAALFFVFAVSSILVCWDYIFYVANRQYANTVGLFSILATYKLFEVLASWRGTAINILGLSSWVMKISLAVLLLNIFLNFLLIPLYQAIGAAVATSICLIIYYSLLMLKYQKERTINTAYEVEKE